MPKQSNEEVLKLPAANEFSPGQIDLETVLKIVSEEAGDRKRLVEAIRAKYFAQSAERQNDPSQRFKVQSTLAGNVLIGMKGYGLFDSEKNSLTQVGGRLLEIQDKESRYREFAKHILTECHGMKVIDAIRGIQERGDKVLKNSLAQELKKRGFYLPRATTHHTKVVQWLREAKVIEGSYELNGEVLADLTGVTQQLLGTLPGLSSEQKAFLHTMRRLGEEYGEKAIPAQSVVDHCVYEHGPIFKMDQLRAKIFRPLERDGWIILSSVGAGRGGKSGKIAATRQLLDVDLGPLMYMSSGSIPPELQRMRNTPLARIYHELTSEDTYTKGIALELLALRVASDLTLIPLRFRERSSETGGAEVDLIAEGVHLHFSRWLFQCKNTKKVALSALAKEVGMAVFLKAHVIVLVTTGQFAPSVVAYAEELARTSPFQAVLVDGKLLEDYRESGIQVLLRYFHTAAQQTMKLKGGQIEADG